MARIAVISPSTLVGREVLRSLTDLPAARDVSLFSERMAGSDLEYGNGELTIEELDTDLLEDPPAVAIFAGVPRQSKAFAPRLAEAGTRVIDLSSAFRLDGAVPLLVEPPTGGLPPLVSVPSGAALAAYRVLRPLREDPGVARLDATLLVPVSAAGAAGVRELSRQSAALLSGGTPRPKRFAHRIAFNIHPAPGEAVGSETRGEVGFRDELRRMLGQPALAIAVSSARVPVFFGLSLALTIDTARPTTLPDIEARFRSSHGGLKLLLGSGVDAMPSLAAGDPSVLLGRLRGEGSRWQLWGCVDPLRMRAELAVAAARRVL